MIKAKIGFASTLLGVLLLALTAYQANMYISAFTIAESAKTMALQQIQDAAQTGAFTQDQLNQYAQQIDESSQSAYLLANSFIPSIILDLILGALFLAAGLWLSKCECQDEKHAKKH